MQTKRIQFMSVVVAATAFVASSTLFGCMLNSTHTKHMQELKLGIKEEMKHTEESMAMRCDTEKDIMKKLLIGDLEKTRSELGDELAIYKSILTRVLGEQVTDKALQKSKISQLERMRTAMQKRTDDYQQLIDKLHQMKISGTLQVKFRKGLMAVQLPSDILFTGNGIALKTPAKEALTELAQTLSTFSDRRFQVVGHSDDRPIRTRRYSSNWELSTQRAVQVVKTLVEAGVKPELISAAGAAHFDPVAKNESPEGRKSNRRVEIIFVPKIDEIPGGVEKVAKTKPQETQTAKADDSPIEIVPIQSASPKVDDKPNQQSDLAKTTPQAELNPTTNTSASTTSTTSIDSSTSTKSTASAMSSTKSDL